MTAARGTIASTEATKTIHSTPATFASAEATMAPSAHAPSTARLSTGLRTLSDARMGPVTGDLHTFSDPNHVPSLLQQPATCEVSVLTFSGGWPEDLRRFAAGLAPGSPAVDYELLASANASPEVETAIRDLAAADRRVRGLSFSQHVGFGGGRNAGILQARGRVVVVADTSGEP